MEYFSDASLSTDSDLEEDEPLPEIYCPRELDYWELEELLDSRGPPPVIEYLKKVGVVTLRTCVFASGPDINDVVDSSSASCWDAFWSGAPYARPSNISFDEWNAIGEFCMEMCRCCFQDPEIEQVKSCMTNVLKLGKFVRPKAGRAAKLKSVYGASH